MRSLRSFWVQVMDGDGMVRLSYLQITQEEAQNWMTLDDGHVVVDVRRPDEYAEGHIPGAINIPNEDIGPEPPEALPDKAQIILIYCRSGNRSKQAAEKLAQMGYLNLYEFGGILDWTGEIVREERLTITFINEVEETDLWILPDTAENRKLSLWGTATAADVNDGEARPITLEGFESPAQAVLHMITMDEMYFGVTDVPLADGYTLRFIADPEWPAVWYLQVTDAEGAEIAMLEVFGAHL